MKFSKREKNTVFNSTQMIWTDQTPICFHCQASCHGNIMKQIYDFRIKWRSLWVSRVVIGNGSMISFLTSNHLQVVYTCKFLHVVCIRVETDHLTFQSIVLICQLGVCYGGIYVYRHRYYQPLRLGEQVHLALWKLNWPFVHNRQASLRKKGFANNDVERVNLKAFNILSFRVKEKLVSILSLILNTKLTVIIKISKKKSRLFKCFIMFYL